MLLRTKLFGETYEFRDIKDLLAKANEEKSGDQQAGDRSQDRRRTGGCPARAGGGAAQCAPGEPCGAL